jgi:hypothetical protein
VTTKKLAPAVEAYILRRVNEHVKWLQKGTNITKVVNLRQIFGDCYQIEDRRQFFNECMNTVAKQMKDEEGNVLWVKRY